MRLRDQLFGVAALALATYVGLVRIAEAKCDEAVGSRGIRLDESAPQDLGAFGALMARLERIGEGEFAARLEELRRRREVWVAPGLGPDRWAAYVESLGLAKRIYIRRLALLSPRAHLYPGGAPGVPEAYQDAYAFLSLSGAMRHELAHRDGAIEEADAYAEELAWYRHIAASSFIAGLGEDERPAWDWALESAIRSAETAASRAGAAPATR